MNTTEILNSWSYEHSIGFIYVEGWGKPFLIVTENKYWKNQHWGYDYYKLGVLFETEKQAREEVEKLNNELKIKNNRFNSEQSQNILLNLQSRFPMAEIAKNNCPVS